MDELTGKRVLFLGAVRQLNEAVRYARSMGLYTVVTDYLPNSPAKKYADKACMVSTTDVEAVVQLCKEEKIDGLFTAFIDSMLPYAREICDRMDFPFYASHDQIRLSLDKEFFKKVCRENGVDVPVDYFYDPNRGEFDKEIRYPVIVKPVDSSGGRGVRICNDRESLQAAYEHAMGLSRSRRVLVEEYVVGDEISATYTMKNGTVSLSCLKDKLLSKDHADITSQSDVLFMPSAYLKLYMEKMNGAVTEMLKAMIATDGTVFFQGIATHDRIVLFECGYRPNGACDYRHIERENGVNYLKSMIAHAITGQMHGYEPELDNPAFKKYVLTYNLWGHGGTIGSMEGLEKVSDIPNVVEAEYMHEPGEVISDSNTLSQRMFRAIIIDDSVDRIKDTILKIQRSVCVLDTEGNNMLYSPFDVARLDVYGGSQ